MKNKAETLRDAVHGDIEFSEDEMRVIGTPQFQRLRGVRQLGLTHLIYPCAQHSRFEHSLGVAHMADQIINAVKKNCPGSVSDADRSFIRALALVHDIGHVPFGHTLEDERPIFGDGQRHDDRARLKMLLQESELENALTMLGNGFEQSNLVADLARTITRTHTSPDTKLAPNRDQFLATFIGDTICADLLDYLARDTFFTGLRHRYDDRIISAFDADRNQLFLDLTDDLGDLRRSVLSEIFTLLRLRYTLAERVYYHQLKSAASAMISKAVELSELPQSLLGSLRDEELLFILEEPSIVEVQGHKVRNKDAVRHIVGRLRRQRLYYAAYVTTRTVAGSARMKDLARDFHSASGIATRREAEDWIAASCGLRTEQVVIFCPQGDMAKKVVRVLVRWPGRSISELEEQLKDRTIRELDDEVARDEIGQLADKHDALWQMMVFVDCDEGDKCEAVRACAQERFGVPDARMASRALLPVHRKVLEAVLKIKDDSTLDAEKCLTLFDNSTQLRALSPKPLADIQNALPRLEQVATGKHSAVPPPSVAMTPLFPAKTDGYSPRQRLYALARRYKSKLDIANYETRRLGVDVTLIESLPEEFRESVWDILKETLPPPGDVNSMTAVDFSNLVERACAKIRS